MRTALVRPPSHRTPPPAPPRRRRGQAVRTAAAGLALAALVAGCSGSVQVGSAESTGPSGEGTPTASPSGELLDTAKAASVISDAIGGSVGPDVPVEITCPEQVAIVKGGTFACTGTVAGQPITVDVVQKDGTGNVSYESQQSLIELSKAEAGIAADADKRQGTTDVEVSCPGPDGAAWVVALPGATFDCTFTSAKSSGQVVVTVKDNVGNVEWVYRS